MVDNVVHFVLARPEGAGPGTKGLSLFILTKYDVDLETGELGERNGVYVTNVEKKMGLKVSTTCELTFGGERAGRRHPARRRPRRHRPDVPRHRERPDDGRHQGHRHPVDRLPQRARLRQAARAGRRPHPVDRQGRPARHHHPPPRRAPLADDPEGVRRGPARAGALHRQPAGHRRPAAARHRVRGVRARLGRRHRQPGQRPAAADRQGPGLRAGLGAARHRVAADLRRLRLPAGLPGRAVRARRQDRHALRGHHRHPGPGLLLPQDRQGQGPGADATCPRRCRSSPRTSARTAAASTATASCSARASRTSRASSASWSAS